MQRRRYGAGLGLAMGLVAMVLGLTACNGIKGGNDSIHAHLRFVNLLTDQPTVNVLLDDTTQLTGLAFEASSTYQDTDWGSYTAKINSASGSLLGSFTLAPAQKSHSTTYLWGSAAGLHSASFTDERYAVSDGKFVVRTLLAADNLPGFDLYLTAADADLASLSPTIYAYSAGSMSSYSSETTAGSYRVRFTTPGTKTVVFDSTLNFDAKTATTLVLHSAGSAQLPTVLRITPDDGSASVVANSLSRLRVVQGSPDVAATRVAVDGNTVYQGLPFAGVTNYLIQPAGSHTLTFSNEAGTGVYLSQPASLQPGRDYTLFSSGLAATAQGLLFEDANLAAASGRSRGHFINATADQPAIDAVVNYQPLLRNLAVGQRSAAIDLDALAYPISYNASGNGSLLAQQTTDTLLAGGAYTFALLGAANSYKAVVFKTN